MSTEINLRRLKTVLPIVKNIQWHIERENEPQNWKQELWENAFGCENRSPLIGTTVEVTKPTTPTEITVSATGNELSGEHYPHTF